MAGFIRILPTWIAGGFDRGMVPCFCSMTLPVHRLTVISGLFWALPRYHHPEYNMTVASERLSLVNPLNRPSFASCISVVCPSFICISIATNIWGIAQHTRLVGRLPCWIVTSAIKSRCHDETQVYRPELWQGIMIGITCSEPTSEKGRLRGRRTD